MSFSVAGKSAIVTGAGSGINLCFAQLLLERGCNVLIADIALTPDAQKVVETHSDPSASPRVIYTKTNVAVWKELENMFEVAKKEFGNVHVVVPGAGVWEPDWSSFWYPPGHPKSRDAPTSNSYAELDINISHPIRTTQLAISTFLQQLKRAPDSSEKYSILHVSSIAAQVFPVHAPMYNASKHAINGFVRSIARIEERYPIRVTAVAPGIIKTPIWTDRDDTRNAFEEGKDTWVDPIDVARCMLALIEQDRIKADMCFTKEVQKSEDIATWIEVRGGTIVEITAEEFRAVKPWDDPGPLGRKGSTASNLDSMSKKALDALDEDGWGVV